MPPQTAHRGIAPGDLVGLNEDGRFLIAVVTGVRGTRVDLRVGYEAKALQRPLRQLETLASLPADHSPPERSTQAPWRLSAERVQEALPVRRELSAAWLLLQEDPGPIDLAGFTALVGDGDDPAQRAACWIWLQKDGQTLFRWRQQAVEARPLAEVRRLRGERKQVRLADERRRSWQEALRQRQPIQVATLAAQHRSQLEVLRSWAAGDTSQPLDDELRRSLQAAHCHAEAGAIRHLLVDLGQWERHHLPSLEHSTWQAGFSEALKEEARRLVALAEEERPGDQLRLDLTGHRAVTIDDEDTKDIDDALSLESLATGRQRLWIHIADPARLVEAGSPLDLEARRRGASLYLARGSQPMFPQELATGPLSLRSGRRCPGWSVAVELADDGSVATHLIARSWVKPTFRLSYGEADELIELVPPQEAWLAEIHQLMERRRSWRVARGALTLDQAEGRIRCEGETARLEITEPSPSRLMVAEAMILAGAVIADHGRSHGLALPYRSQLPVELPPQSELEGLPPGPVRHAAIKRCLSRGHVGTTPSAHFSLGLEAYVQATSPIRRYGDLVAQRQLLAHDRGDSVLGETELGELLAQLEAPMKQGIQISREDQRHWQQVWFEQQEHHQWKAVFLRWLRPQDRLGLVHVEELAMDLAAECPAGSEPAAPLLLRLLQVDSLRDLLKFQAVG